MAPDPTATGSSSTNAGGTSTTTTTSASAPAPVAATEAAATEPTSSSATANPIKTSCHCGLVTLTLPHPPKKLNECQCSLCWRYGAVWAYYQRADVVFSMPPADSPEAPRPYTRADGDGRGHGFFFCGRCGGLTHWAGYQGKSRDNPRMGVNTRMVVDRGVLEGVERFFGRD